MASEKLYRNTLKERTFGTPCIRVDFFVTANHIKARGKKFCSEAFN